VRCFTFGEIQSPSTAQIPGGIENEVAALSPGGDLWLNA
jgi:hypothetical protein